MPFQHLLCCLPPPPAPQEFCRTAEPWSDLPCPQDNPHALVQDKASRPARFWDASLVRAEWGKESACGWRWSSCLLSWHEMSRSNAWLSARGSVLGDLPAACVGIQENVSRTPSDVLTADLQCLQLCSPGWTRSAPLAGLLSCCGERKGGVYGKGVPVALLASPMIKSDAEQHQQTLNRH